MTSYIAKVYADLVRKELKTIDQVPAKIRDEVKSILAGGEK